ncbi:MAG TPA: ferritin family protein [Ferrovibrio sp.]|uniref:ferritin-like domain-containing protein n=1 Tax=Ferrovibrio sp. TaxID=1917215 RepID=UPI002ED3E9F8
MGNLLSSAPEMGVASLTELIGIAHALEAESVRRYELLAGEMKRLGALDTAATFRLLLKEEQGHIDAVESWAADLHETVPSTASFTWRLPPDIASSWDEVSGSALLTPYRALSIAVTNEERAFAYYTYIAAHTDNPRIARAAEEMAQEELRHATHLRQFRRRAYHQERHETPEIRQALSSLPAFEARIRDLCQRAAREHIGIAAELHRRGDVVSTALIADLARQEIQSAGPAATIADIGEDLHGDPVALLHRAKAPVERLAEFCELVAMKAESEAVLAAAQKTLSDAVAVLARIALRAEQLDELRSA